MQHELFYVGRWVFQIAHDVDGTMIVKLPNGQWMIDNNEARLKDDLRTYIKTLNK